MLGMMNPDQTCRIMEDLVEVYQDPKIYKFLLLSVRSGSDVILGSMNRRYTVSDFTTIISLFRSGFPPISIATDVVVGFLGEGEEQFLQTREFLECVRPDVMNISKYAPRPGTLASKMKQQDGKIISLRSRTLPRSPRE